MMEQKERKLDGKAAKMKQELNALEDRVAQAFNSFHKQTGFSVCCVSVTKIKTISGETVHHCVQLEASLE